MIMLQREGVPHLRQKMTARGQSAYAKPEARSQVSPRHLRLAGRDRSTVVGFVSVHMSAVGQQGLGSTEFCQMVSTVC
jgi:hypothetical protein